MIIFQSFHDILIDTILDLDSLSASERSSLLISSYGVPFKDLDEIHKQSFKSGILKWLRQHNSFIKFYEKS